MSENFSQPTSNDATEGFITQVMEQQRALYAYILSLTQVLTEADDVLQEVNLVLWRKRGEYKPGTNFQAWAFSIAKYQVLAWQKRQSRDRARFSDDLLARLAETTEQRASQSDDRLAALVICVEKLRQKDRNLLRQRYGEGRSTAEISQADGRTRDGIYYALSKIHEKLRDCVRRQLRTENR